MEYAEGAAGTRKFVDWRKAFLIFALMGGRIPTEADVQEYITRLREKAEKSRDGQLDKAAFVKVSKRKFEFFPFTLFLTKLISYRSMHGLIPTRV